MDRFSRMNTSRIPLDDAIELVTDPTNPNENWTMIMDICDEVATQNDSAKTAIIEIKKKLRKNPVTYGWRSIALTLTLLEALVNNGGYSFHVLLGNEDFLRALKSVIAPKNDPPKPIEDHVLNMIQHWALIFSGDSELEIIEELYQECKRQGYRFPKVNNDCIVKSRSSIKGQSNRPISALEKKATSTSQTMARPKTSSGSNRCNKTNYSDMPSNNNNALGLIKHLSDEQIGKLRSELDIVHLNVDVLDEMLATLEPGDEHLEDWQLLLDLYQACKKMQARIVSLLSLVAKDDIAVDLLRCNDQLNKTFNSYHHYMEVRENFLQQVVSNRSTESQNRTRLSNSTNSPSSPIKTPSTPPVCIGSDNEDQPIVPPKRQAIPRNNTQQELHTTDTRTSIKGNRDSSVTPCDFPPKQNFDKKSVSMKLPPIQLTRLPDPEPRSAAQPKIIRRERSAGILTRKSQNYDDDQNCYNDTEEEKEQDSIVKNVDEADEHTHGKLRSKSHLPSRIKRLTIDSNDCEDGPYKITTYHHIGSD